MSRACPQNVRYGSILSRSPDSDESRLLFPLLLHPPPFVYLSGIVGGQRRVSWRRVVCFQDFSPACVTSPPSHMLECDKSLRLQQKSLTPIGRPSSSRRSEAMTGLISTQSFFFSDKGEEMQPRPSLPFRTLRKKKFLFLRPECTRTLFFSFDAVA